MTRGTGGCCPLLFLKGEFTIEMQHKVKKINPYRVEYV